MLWFIAPAAVGAVAAIIWAISDDEKKARQRWQDQYEAVERSVEEHREIVRRHIHEANTSYDFQLLIDLHYSSQKVANSAYTLLDDARQSILAMSRILDQITEKKNALKISMQSVARSTKESILQEVRELNLFKSNVLQDLMKVKAQRDHLLSEVRKFNAQTRSLKEAIRDRCGARGFDWYVRLEERKAAKRASQSA